MSSEKKDNLGFHHIHPDAFEPLDFSTNVLLEDIRNQPDRLDVQSKKYFEKTNYQLFPKTDGR